MRNRGIIIILCLGLFLSSCGKEAEEIQIVSCAYYIPKNMGYYNNELLLLMDYRLYTVDSETEQAQIICQKPGCSHKYSLNEKNTCRAALPQASTVGVYNGKIYVSTLAMGIIRILMDIRFAIIFLL